MPSYGPTGVLCVGLGRSPFDATRTVSQEGCGTPTGCQIQLSDGQVLWKKGTNQVVAGGSGLAAWIDVDGIYGDSAGRTRTDAYIYPQAVGPHGEVLLRPHSNADAIIWRLDGTEIHIDGDIQDPSFLPDGSLMYRLGSNQFVAPVPAPDPDFSTWGWPVLVDGKLLYQSYRHGCLVYDGKVLATGANFYKPCGFKNADGSYKFAWATQPQEIGVTTEITRTLAQLAALPNVTVVPSPAPTPAPVPPPSPKPEPVVTVPNFSHVVTDVLAARPDLAKANTLAAGGEVVHLTVEKIRETDTRFGYVSKVPGETQYEGDSQDSIAFKDDSGAVVSIKILSGVGDAHEMWPRWDVGGALRSTDHWQYPGTATFGATTTPAPTSQPPAAQPPAPAVDPAVTASIRQLGDAVLQLVARVSALESRPAPTVDLSGYLRVGAKASGHVSIMDVAETKQISWDVKNPE